jgi:hypothetical protein
MEQDRRDVLLKEYGEVSNNFRLLTDIRFRLLAFLPIATAAAAALTGDAVSGRGLVLSLSGSLQQLVSRSTTPETTSYTMSLSAAQPRSREHWDFPMEGLLTDRRHGLALACWESIRKLTTERA